MLYRRGRPLSAFDAQRLIPAEQKEEIEMIRMSRRQVLGGIAAAAATLGAPSVHAQKGRQTLRFIAEADLKLLDPIWQTGYITRNHSYLVYDTLFGTEENHQIKPQMVDRTTISEDGMHDGPGDISCLGHWPPEILPTLSFRLRVRRSLRNEDRSGTDHQTRPDESETAREGVWLRRQARRCAPRHR